MEPFKRFKLLQRFKKSTVRYRLAALLFCIIFILAIIATELAMHAPPIKIVSPVTVPVAIPTTTNPISTPVSAPPITITPTTTESASPSTPTPAPPPAAVIVPQNVLNRQFGVSVGETLLGLDDADLNARLNNIASLGIGWLRFDIQWDQVEPNNANDNTWIAIDRAVAAANAHHMGILAILDYTPAWDRPADCPPRNDKCLPPDTASFDNFVRMAVARYGPEGISHWEIWNEPNTIGSVQPGFSVMDYVTLLKSAYVTIKDVQPSSTVITGGLGPAQTSGGNISPLDFLSQLYADGAQGYFDAVGDHPYSYPAMPLYEQPWNAWSQMASTTPSLRSIMIANGDADKKIWLTEYGAPTDGPGTLEDSTSDTVFAGRPDHVTEVVQAAMLAQAIGAVQQYPWAGPMFIYTYRDLGTSNNTIENFFGVVRDDGSTKPAYATIKTLLAN